MPAVAVTVVAPFATAVTRPELETVATPAFPVDHAGDVDKTAPDWSRTVAVTCMEAPMDVSTTPDTDNSIADGVGFGSVPVGVLGSEQALATEAVMKRRQSVCRGC